MTRMARAIYRQYALALIGLLACLFCLFWFNGDLLIDFIFIGFIGLCLVAAWRCFLRHRAVVTCDEYTISLLDVGVVKLDWHKIDQVRLSFFSQRSDQREGWMRLTLTAEKKTIKIDSQIEKFYTLADRAARAAKDNGVRLDEISRLNFKALGLSFPEWDQMAGGSLTPRRAGSRINSDAYRRSPPRRRHG